MRHEVIWQRCIQFSTNAVSHCVAGEPLVYRCTFMCFGGGMIMQGRWDLAFKASLLLLAFPKSPTLPLIWKANLECPRLTFCPSICFWQYSRLGAMLTHSCSLGYNGAALQALAVHLSLQGALALPKEFINKLISEMEEMEKDETAQLDAKA